MEQFFAEYGEAGKKVFEEDSDYHKDKVTLEDEGNRDNFEEEKYVKKLCSRKWILLHREKS